MATFSTNRARYEELMKDPLIFLHKVEHSSRDNNGITQYHYSWESIDDDFEGSCSERDFRGNGLGRELVVAEQVRERNSDSENSENDSISFSVHAINGSSQDDWRLVINSFIIRSQNPDDKYPYIHLLWLLNFGQWNSNTIIQILRLYDVNSRPYVINNALYRVSRCLSESKQLQMKTALAAYNVTYEVYLPSFLAEAFYKLSPRPEYDRGKIDLYRLVDLILEAGDKEGSPRLSFEENTNNPFLNVYRWLHDSDTSIDYSILNSVYALSPHKIQKRIVQRYFHDIRQGRTSLDIQLLEQFKNNKFSDFIRYRYCLEHPGEPINLSVPFLCDCIQTILQTQGESFQSFNGILDFAMTHCDVTMPVIRLGMEEFLPLCDGGAVYNSSFRGFIDYSVVCELDESKFTQENLLASIRKMLDTRTHHTYPGCRFDDEKRPFSEEQSRYCYNQRSLENEQYNRTQERCPDYIKYPYENKWVVYDTDYTWVNLFLSEPLPQVPHEAPRRSYIIDIAQTSTDVLENHIRSFANQCERIGEKGFIIKSDKVRDSSLLRDYSRPISMRIIPQLLPIIGMKFDVFGIKQNLCMEHNVGPYSLSNDIKEEFKKQEAAEVNRRVVETLKRELNINEYNGTYFEVPYDRELLRRLIGLYYYKGTIPTNPVDSDIEFLRKQDNRRFAPFCAPNLADKRNMATNLPFFWCLGTECFHNNLGHQTLEECSSWKYYTLYHMIEIIGYPKIRRTEAGYEPDDTIKKFIACANRVSKAFRRLKCRNCGHLLYTARRSLHSIYNNFSCVNPTCPEHDNVIYLSYCYKCKKGLIDSRDSVLCPNGWYICPTCHSCCNDELYERQAQRYILQNRVVPDYIESKRGHGHNDKGIFFCHRCGTELQMFGENRNEKWGCPQCHVEYPRTIDNRYDEDFYHN